MKRPCGRLLCVQGVQACDDGLRRAGSEENKIPLAQRPVPGRMRGWDWVGVSRMGESATTELAGPGLPAALLAIPWVRLGAEPAGAPDGEDRSICALSARGGQLRDLDDADKGFFLPLSLEHL